MPAADWLRLGPDGKLILSAPAAPASPPREAAARPSPAALGLLCPVCLSLMDEPVTLQCGHSLCTICKNGLVQQKTRELAPGVYGWRAHPCFPIGSSSYEIFRTRELLSPAKQEAYSAVTCPVCRRESRSDALATSVQLRSSIGALFPEMVQARAEVKRLSAAMDAACAIEAERRAAHAPKLAEKAAATKAAGLADLRKFKAVVAEAREAECLAKASAKAAEAKAALGAAQEALCEIEKAQAGDGGGGGGGGGGKKRKR